MAGDVYLVDTNIVLRLVQWDSPDHAVIKAGIDELWAQGAELFYTSQNMAEFWNVCTRPRDRNGFGLSTIETDRRASLIELRLGLAAEGEATHREWRRIVVEHAVMGVQVHDARLVATMRVHRITKLLTLNGQDFRRYGDIDARPPHDFV